MPVSSRMGQFRQDLRYASRILARNPSYALAALLSLAIGIGANTAIFSIINALLLRPLPYQNAGRLVILWNRSPGLGITQDWFSTAQYFDIQAAHQGFEQLAIAIGGNNNLTGQGEAERVGTVRVSSNLLPMLGVKAASGHLFVAADDVPGQPPSALLSYGLWKRRYGADPQMVGKSIQLNGQPWQVIGVLPKSFSLPREVLPTLGGAEDAEIVLPLPLGPGAARLRTHEDYNIVGLLKRGVTLDQARARMVVITARLRRDYPEQYPPNGGLTFGVVPLLEQVVGDVRRPLYVLLAAVGLVLLVACANVANLLLARSVARQKEIALRAAFGASRNALLQQLLTESTLLALTGGALGTVFAMYSLDWVRLLGPESIPRLASVAIDGRVLLFTLAVSLMTGVLFGVAPALRLSQVDLMVVLKETGRGASGGGALWGKRFHLRSLLVLVELSLSLMLLIGASLLLRSFANLQHVSPGFDPAHTLTFGLTMSGPQYNDPHKVLNGYRQLWEGLKSLPGVTAAGGTIALPLTPSFAWTPIVVEGRAAAPDEKFLNADMRIIGGEYFQTMEIPLRSGRFFTPQDDSASPPVTIIDDGMARQLWPRQDPIGKRIKMVESGPEGPWLTVVGVAGRVKHESLDSDPRIVFYVPQTQSTVRALSVVVRTAGDPASLASGVSAVVRGIDSDLPLYRIRTMQQLVDESLARRRFSMLALAIFAALALVLAAIGIYGVMAYVVSQGTREIGIRIALGATEGGILRMVVRQGMRLVLAGIAIGLAGAFALTRLMKSLLFGVAATDTLTFVAIPLILGAVALLATYLPARRATRVEPSECLRSE